MISINQKTPVPSTTASFNVDAWLSHVGQDRPQQDIDALKAVYEIMDNVVEYQQHISGESELLRALYIVEILAGLRVDTDTLLAALLHALAQASAITSDEIRTTYGNGIANLVEGIDKMRIMDAYQIQHSNEPQDRHHMESVRKLLLALAQDVRVVLIKLAERLQIMRTLRGVSDTVKRQLAGETRDIYAPLASRLGIWQLKWELEDYSFRYLDGDNYQKVADMLAERRIDREKYITSVTDIVRSELSKMNITADVSGRPKHIYSIWRKMNKKAVGFSDVFDVRATRVLVESVADCYAVLGVVHSLWQPIRSEFDDYIATPKKNDYQSLHTAVIGPGNKTLEIQIRTLEMHQHCEFGVAAHWRYKEGGKQDTKYQEKIAWFRQILEWKDTGIDDGDFIEQFKSEVFEDRVYVLTPRGNVIDLARGATVLDFAYHIHTDVGHHFRGAKVDGKIVPISYELENGQQVEVLTSKNSSPSRDWLNPHLGYANSAKTRTKIRYWFKQLDYGENVSHGREMLGRELRRLAISDTVYGQLVERFKYKTVDDLFAAIGHGDITTAQIASAVNEFILPDAAKQADEKGSIRYLRRRQPTEAQGGIDIMGVGGLATKVARCCKPVPFDPISGFITRGYGVTIHRCDCSNLLRMQREESERIIEVTWGNDDVTTYPVDIHIRAFDRQGLLRDITNILSDGQLNVMSVNTHTDRKTYQADMTFSLQVTSVDQLSQALLKIEQLPNITHVSRRKS